VSSAFAPAKREVGDICLAHQGDYSNGIQIMVVLVPVRGRYTGGRQGNKRVGSTKVGLALCKVWRR